MSYRITETNPPRVVERNGLPRARLIAYDAVIRMVHDNTQLGREIRRVRAWNGNPLTITYGGNSVILEAIE